MATRYDRCPKVFLSAIALAAIVICWLLNSMSPDPSDQADGWNSGWLADQAEDPASVSFSLETPENDDSGVLVGGSFRAPAG